MRWTQNLALLSLAVMAGCSTTPKTVQDTPTPVPEPVVSSEAGDRLKEYTFMLEKQPLGLAVREVVRITEVNLVLMNGLENYPLDRVEVVSSTIEDILDLLSKQIGFKIQDSGSYFFLYAPDYEPLTQVHVDPTQLGPHARLKTTAGFGADTPLFNVFALLGRSLDTTIVGDNAVADSACGELHLRDVTLTEALEAVFKSARVQQFNFRVQGTEEYLFFYSPGNRQRTRFTTGATPPSGVDLAAKCNLQLLFLDTGDGKFEGQLASSRLNEVLPDLSRQLGISVSAEPALHKLPVNPVIMTNVSRKTALELLIRQWLLPEFGYDYTEDGIRLRYLGPER
jgi:hypothetical protein